MKLKLLVGVLPFIGAALCVPQASFAQATVKIDGSSTVFPIVEAVAEEFQISKRGKVRVTVGIWHRRRFQEVLSRRDRYLQRIPADTQS
jgi:ABC-type phosphate transport system substrate-binding protein